MREKTGMKVANIAAAPMLRMIGMRFLPNSAAGEAAIESQDDRHQDCRTALFPVEREIPAITAKQDQVNRQRDDGRSL